jgi:DNA-directed RNA polymerase specialized sigma24 family protein
MSTYTMEDLRAMFESRYRRLRAMSRKQMGWQRTVEQRDDLTDAALAMAWKYVRRSFLMDLIHDEVSAWDQCRYAIRYATKHALRGQTLEGTRPIPPKTPGARDWGERKLDAYDKGRVASRAEIQYLTGRHEEPTFDTARFQIDITEFMATLTERKRQFVTAILQGHPNKELAHIFGVQVSTIWGYKGEMKRWFRAYFGD